MARPPSDKPLARLDFPLTPRVSKRLFDLQESMRKKGHGRQSPRTIVSALIMTEARRGDDLYKDLLVPFRLRNPDAD